MNQAPNDLLQTILRAISPDPVLSISEWADKFRILGDDMAEPGKWRTARTPYLKKFMDDMSPNSSVSKIVVQKASQLGFTEALLNALLYYVQYVPSSQMVVYPTVQIAERTSKGRIEKSIAKMPSLRDVVGDRKQREGSNTILEKAYPGGHLYLSGSNSPSTLCSTPIKIVYLDEVDRFAPDCGGEGAPTKLAEKRTSTYGSNKKIIYVSTPTEAENSVIVSEFQTSDQNYCYVPCPHCSFYQTIEFEQLRYTVAGKTALDVKLECKNCGALIEEYNKGYMLERLEWRASNPQSPTRGYFINSLYAPPGWDSWAVIASEREKSRGNREEEKVFVNTRLGQPYVAHGEAPDVELVYLKREAYEMGACPHGVLFLTMGADIQANRIEAEVVGWGLNHESWSIDHVIFDGDTNLNEVWEDFEKFIRDKLYDIEGSPVKLPIQIAFVDSGYRTQKVYNFVRKFGGLRVYPIKGQDNYDKAVSSPSYVEITLTDTQKKLKKGIALYHVGVSLLKDNFYSNLKIQKPKDGEKFPPWYCHFPEYDYKYFQSLCSEKCVMTSERGRVRLKWVKIFERNEALDVRIYATAAATLYGFNQMSDEKLEKMYLKLYKDVLPRETTEKEVQKITTAKKTYTIKRRTGSYMGE